MNEAYIPSKTTKCLFENNLFSFLLKSFYWKYVKVYLYHEKKKNLKKKEGKEMRF